MFERIIRDLFLRLVLPLILILCSSCSSFDFISAAEAWKGKASNALKAVTILTLVKLVLQKEETANSIMPIFKEILSSNSVDPTIQVNTIIGMCDLCSR